MYVRRGMTLSTGLAALAIACCVSLPTSNAEAATTWQVNNCNDTGAGSLRDIASKAGNADLIDLRHAGCRRIKLAGGPIALPQAYIRILGPGRTKLVIDGDNKSSVLRHTGSNTLWIAGVAVENGHHQVLGANGHAQGGCIYSRGVLRLDNSEVRHCSAEGSTGASGGGVYGTLRVDANGSAIFSNSVTAPGAGNGQGGGVYSGRLAHLKRSRVLDNEASGSGGGVYASTLQAEFSTIADNYAGTLGGGVYLTGLNTRISNSTISGNSAESTGGGVYGASLHFTNSTISGNRAANAGAIYSNWDELFFEYSTVAFNESDWSGDGTSCATTDVKAAVVGTDVRTPYTRLDNSILANNLCAGKPGYDLWLGYPAIAEFSILNASKQPLPDGAISADPKLGPLADNGGPTLTHALQSGSAAVDVGTSPYAAQRDWDQRGPGYPGLKGAESDAGAYEK